MNNGRNRLNVRDTSSIVKLVVMHHGAMTSLDLVRHHAGTPPSAGM